jgi:hypothetical protein
MIHMKIKSTVGNDNRAIVLPVECAGLAAEIMAKATVYKRDGYYSTSGWKVAEEGICISYTTGTELEPTHPKVEEAQKQYSEANSARWEEHRKREAAEKELAETKAALAVLQSTVTCQQTTPEAPVDAEPPFWAEHEEAAEE